MRRGKLIIGAGGTGSFTQGTVTQDSFQFLIYGETEEGITEKAIEAIKGLTGIAKEDTSESYRRDFSMLPAKVLQKLQAGEQFGIELDYGSHENAAGASWRIAQLPGDLTLLRPEDPCTQPSD